MGAPWKLSGHFRAYIFPLAGGVPFLDPSPQTLTRLSDGEQ